MDTKKLRQKILDLAIHGRLVPQDPNDEPASVLLERIRAEKEKLIKEGKIKAPKKSKFAGDTSHYPKDMPFEVPEGWTWCNFTEVAELISGQDFPPEKYNSNSQGTPYIIGASNIEEGHLRINRWTEYPSVLSHKGDVLVVCKGAGVGKVAVNDLGIVHIARQIQAVRIQNDIVSPAFMRMLIDWCVPSIVSQANGLIPGLKRELLLGVLLPIPPQKEQERIVSTVCTVNAIINDLEAKRAQIEGNIRKTKEKVLDLAIRGKLVAQDPNDEPAIEVLKRINPSFTSSHNLHYHDYLPNGWCAMTFGEVAEYINGRAFKPEEWEKEGLPIVRIQNLNDSFAEYNYSTGTFEKKYLIHHGDLLFAWAASLNAYIWSGEDAWLNQHIFKVIPKNIVLPKYLYYTLKAKIHDFYQRSHGSGMVHITRNTFLKETILLPSMNEQERIVVAIEELYATMDSLTVCLTT